MKFDRLFEIVYILLSRRSMTASELAEHFEVSQRTIYRDIETLSGAGIPLYMQLGKGGGIRLIEDFVLDKSIISERNQHEILTALQGLKASRFPSSQGALEQMSLIFNKKPQDWIEIDFSDWGGDAIKWEEIKSCILERRCICFEYFSSEGESSYRIAIPVKLWFKQSAWYIRAFCMSKRDMRTFRLSRMKNLRTGESDFSALHELDEMEVPPHEMADESTMFPIKLRIDGSQAYRVYDEFDPVLVAKNEDGSFDVTVSFPPGEWVCGYLMSFGCFAEVLSPQPLRDEIKRRHEKAAGMYL